MNAAAAPIRCPKVRLVAELTERHMAAESEFEALLSRLQGMALERFQTGELDSDVQRLGALRVEKMELERRLASLPLPTPLSDLLTNSTFA